MSMHFYGDEADPVPESGPEIRYYKPSDVEKAYIDLMCYTSQLEHYTAKLEEMVNARNQQK